MDPGVETKMYVRFCRSGLLSVTQEPWQKADYCGQWQQETLCAGSGAGRAVGCRAVVKLHGGLGGRWTGWAEEWCLLSTGSVILSGPLFCELCSLHLLGALRELGTRLYCSTCHFTWSSFFPVGWAVSMSMVSTLVQPWAPLTWITSKPSYTKKNVSPLCPLIYM